MRTPTDPFEAMGRRIVTVDPAVEVLHETLGLAYWPAHTILREISQALEANEPADAFAACKSLLGDDVTLHYRVIATLLAHADADAPQQRGGQGIETLTEESH